MSKATRVQGSEDQQLAERRGLIDLLSAEVDEQRRSYASRAVSMNTRLSILIAAASLASGLQIAAHAPHFWYNVGACLAALAAIAGVVGLWPRTGGENGVEDIQGELWNLTPDRAAYQFMHRKLEILREDESTLHWRRYFAVIGFGLLALSIVAVALQVIGVP
jgi:hypothetical protein